VDLGAVVVPVAWSTATGSAEPDSLGAISLPVQQAVGFTQAALALAVLFATKCLKI
jgi:hypothetical protein